MIEPRLASTLVLNTVFAALAVWVGLRIRARHAESPEARRALGMFALWWLAFGADVMMNTLTWLAGGLGFASEPVTAVLTYAALVSIVLMIWGLTYYLAYLITGRATLFVPIAIFYALSLGAMVAVIVSLRPVGVTMGEWAGEIRYANAPPPIAGLLIGLYFLVPPIVGSILYAIVGFRVRDRASRYRILAVAFGILVWFLASILFSAAPSVGTDDAREIVGRTIGATCMLLIVSAYVQPAPFARWLEGGSHDRGVRRAALLERARDLI